MHSSARHRALGPDLVAEAHDHAVCALFDRVDLRAQARVAHEARGKGLGQRVGPGVDVFEVAEDVVVPVGEPLDQREVEPALDVEQRSEQPQRLLADAALEQIAEQRIAVVALDDQVPAAGLRRELDERRHRVP